MDRQFRKQLKSDRFAEEVEHSFSWMGQHSADIKKYGPIALGVLIIAAGIYLYMNHEANARAEDYAQALRIDAANVGAAPATFGGLSYATQAEKDAARAKAFSELATKYHGTYEGSVGQMYMASDAIEKGDLPKAEKLYADVVDSAPKPLASQARLSLADVYAAEGKSADAEKLVRYAIANPTITVSKDEATIVLAKMMLKDHCDEARKLLMPLRMAQSAAISRAAVSALGQTGACSN